jgi:predicted nucleic acid-binding Zn ribbon protein
LLKFKGTGFHATDYDQDEQGYDESAMENKADPDIDTYNYK